MHDISTIFDLLCLLFYFVFDYVAIECSDEFRGWTMARFKNELYQQNVSCGYIYKKTPNRGRGMENIALLVL